MLAGAARTWLNRYAVLPGTRAVLVTAVRRGLPRRIRPEDAGVYIACIADTRGEGELSAAARARGIPVLTQATVLGTSGRLRVSSIELARIVDGELCAAHPAAVRPGAHVRRLHPERAPALAVARQAHLERGFAGLHPGSGLERTRSAGGCRGIFELDAVLADGHAQGAAAAAAARDPQRRGVAPAGGARASAAPPPLAAHGGLAGALPQTSRTRGRAFVDWQNDVTAKDLALALREGFRSIEHVKRYTTTGMATDQGKTSNLERARHRLARPRARDPGGRA